MIIVRLILESFRFAWTALRLNWFRTILSLLGVTIGIFAIIGVLTMVDSLEKNIKDSFSFLGAGVIYVEKWPFVGSPDFPWWKYLQRPNASYDEYKHLEKNTKNSSTVAIFARKGNSTLKRANNSIEGMNLVGATYGYDGIFELNFDQGRYFTRREVEGARNVAMVGANIAETLFPSGNALGKEIKIKGRKYVVIGVMKKEGESFLGVTSNDDNCIVPYNSFRKLYATGAGRFGIGSRIGLKGYEDDVGLVELESEVKGQMRRVRSLKPKDEDNFEINRPEAVTNFLSGIFDGISIAGWIIGGFSILVGGFGIANIMFVSVKERTSIIGIQKSLGAKNYFVLFQFLFESVFLSLIGGGIGIFLVYLITFIPMGSMDVALTLKNIVLGLGVSSAIGTLSGIIPAAVAARLDPVIAIRS